MGKSISGMFSEIGPYLFVCSLTASNVASGQDYPYRTVAVSGVSAPGPHEGVFFSDFLDAQIDKNGRTGFRAWLYGNDVSTSNNLGVWSEASFGVFNYVARNKSQAPGTAVGVIFGSHEVPVFSESGKTTIQATLENGLESDRMGIWSEGAGNGLSLIARGGQQAPGVEQGSLFSRLIEPPVINSIGQTAFLGELRGPGINFFNTYGIWTEKSGAGLTLVARGGMQAPGLQSGISFSQIYPPVINDKGQTAFRAFIVGPQIPQNARDGIWSEGGGGDLSLIARAGDQAVGASTGVVYDSFFDAPIGLDNAGRTAFRGLLRGGGVNSDNNLAIWSEGNGSGLRLIAREGEPAPGTESGVDFHVLNDPRINGEGRVAFFGLVRGPGIIGDVNNRGLWVEGINQELALVARSGQPAPGTGPGVVLSLIQDFDLNGNGQVAFEGAVSGVGVTDDNDRGLWATDVEGNLRLVAREGDLFDANSDPLIDDLRAITSINYLGRSGGDDGLGTSFNDLGQLVFSLDFSDGSSGLFVATIPEPYSFGLLLFGLSIILKRRRI